MWPTEWVTPEGTKLSWNTGPVEKATALGTWRTSLMAAKWSAAAKHFCREGLAAGEPSFAGYLAARK